MGIKRLIRYHFRDLLLIAVIVRELSRIRIRTIWEEADNKDNTMRDTALRAILFGLFFLSLFL